MLLNQKREYSTFTTLGDGRGDSLKRLPSSFPASLTGAMSHLGVLGQDGILRRQTYWPGLIGLGIREMRV
ncbi:hypothetical protein C9I92_23770 [Photobacterium ganghwense]|uniref:Uncharacterized protein n=1 Tax=Photobacterium ganghwense TaxID=320778 RepID=A0A0J1HJF0_9GAMM|nr:hypothetical protein ABT57_00265 [Photobacterium ganghwense]PSU04587.1 hypothetical protein C9I92_23770 [Photobacterium ganghwense]